MKLNLSADEVLTTTRSVRKRLDFDTPVDKNVILECLEIALQAPTGSNSQGWQWMFIDDEAKKDAIAAMYRRNFAEYAKSTREFPEGDTRQSRQTAVRDSAQYLADNFQRVPVVDTSDPFIARTIPSPDESLVVIRFANPIGFDFPYLLSMLHDSFMSRANTLVVPGGKMELAMQLIFTPMILRLMERRKKAYAI